MALTIVKVGGSLSVEPNKLRALMTKLSELAKSRQLVVVPGGAEFADTVRSMDKLYSLSFSVSHRMAILGIDQYGLLLSDLVPGSITVYSFDQARDASSCGNLPIFLPSQVLFSEDPLENSWNVTSDSIALYIAHKLNAKRLLLVTDVDGIYSCDPKQDKSASLLKKVIPSALAAFGKRTSVDAALPNLLHKWPIDCYVINGSYPERVEALLDGKNAVGTLISGKMP